MPKFSDFDLKISLLLSSEKTFSAEKASPILQDRVMPEREILHLGIKRLPSFSSYRSRRLGQEEILLCGCDRVILFFPFRLRSCTQHVYVAIISVVLEIQFIQFQAKLLKISEYFFSSVKCCMHACRCASELIECIRILPLYSMHKSMHMYVN